MRDKRPTKRVAACRSLVRCPAEVASTSPPTSVAGSRGRAAGRKVHATRKVLRGVVLLSSERDGECGCSSDGGRRQEAEAEMSHRHRRRHRRGRVWRAVSPRLASPAPTCFAQTSREPAKVWRAAGSTALRFVLCAARREALPNDVCTAIHPARKMVQAARSMPGRRLSRPSRQPSFSSRPTLLPPSSLLPSALVLWCRCFGPIVVSALIPSRHSSDGARS